MYRSMTLYLRVEFLLRMNAENIKIKRIFRANVQKQALKWLYKTTS